LRFCFIHRFITVFSQGRFVSVKTLGGPALVLLSASIVEMEDREPMSQPMGESKLGNGNGTKCVLVEDDNRVNR